MTMEAEESPAATSGSALQILCADFEWVLSCFANGQAWPFVGPGPVPISLFHQVSSVHSEGHCMVWDAIQSKGDRELQEVPFFI
jgi:hypothetical protein